MAGYVSDAVIRRLPGYYRHLRELEAQDVKHISSQQLGERMQLTPSQIRQDINCFGGFGRQGYGYTVTELKEHIGKILGLDRQHRMIVIGAGNMGSAVAQYPSFAREGFEVIAMFDVDPAKVGTRLGNIPIFPMEDLETYLGDHHVDVAVLSLPVGAAQKTLNRLAECGIRAVWNFAPTDLHHPEEMIVVNVHLSDSLQILSYKKAHMEDARNSRDIQGLSVSLASETLAGGTPHAGISRSGNSNKRWSGQRLCPPPPCCARAAARDMAKPRPATLGTDGRSRRRLLCSPAQ